jgi:hypothetical protein
MVTLVNEVGSRNFYHLDMDFEVQWRMPNTDCFREGEIVKVSDDDGHELQAEVKKIGRFRTSNIDCHFLLLKKKINVD